jgi:flavorubredoxin
MEKLKGYDIQMIAPGHGQIFDQPAWILEAWQNWVIGAPHNVVVPPFVSMHGAAPGNWWIV